MIYFSCFDKYICLKTNMSTTRGLFEIPSGWLMKQCVNAEQVQKILAACRTNYTQWPMQKCANAEQVQKVIASFQMVYNDSMICSVVRKIPENIIAWNPNCYIPNDHSNWESFWHEYPGSKKWIDTLKLVIRKVDTDNEIFVDPSNLVIREVDTHILAYNPKRTPLYNISWELFWKDYAGTSDFVNDKTEEQTNITLWKARNEKITVEQEEEASMLEEQRNKIIAERERFDKQLQAARKIQEAKASAAQELQKALRRSFFTREQNKGTEEQVDKHIAIPGVVDTEQPKQDEMKQKTIQDENEEQVPDNQPIDDKETKEPKRKKRKPQQQEEVQHKCGGYQTIIDVIETLPFLGRKQKRQTVAEAWQEYPLLYQKKTAKESYSDVCFTIEDVQALQKEWAVLMKSCVEFSAVEDEDCERLLADMQQKMTAVQWNYWEPRKERVLTRYQHVEPVYKQCQCSLPEWFSKKYVFRG